MNEPVRPKTGAPPPEWLAKVWANAASRGVHTLTLAEINAEIAAYRRETEAASREAK